MTDASSTPGRFAESDFNVGRVINRTTTVLSRHFMIFFIVAAVAYLPTLLLMKVADDPTAGVVAALFSLFLLLAFSIVSQAVIVHAAFQDMRGRPVHLGESLGVGLARLFPIIGLAVVMAILGGIGFMLLVVPGLILMTMWFVSMPACVVEQLGPLASLGRSSQLTKGHRWKIFGLMLLLIIISIVITLLTEFILGAVGGPYLAGIGSLIWNGIWGAFYAIAAVVSYHDLRVAKEGINIEQIAAVFD
jgi:hypothetical protein